MLYEVITCILGLRGKPLNQIIQLEGFKMLKELIQAMVKDSGAMMNIQAGQLQLAGMSAVEQRALIVV